MTTSNTVTKTDLQNIINAIFPATTEDMTQAQINAFVASLNVSGINAADYIVEEGTSDGWAYRKWHSGRMVAEKNITTGTSWDTTSAPIYTNQTTITPPTGMTVTGGYANITQASVWAIHGDVQLGSDIKLTVFRATNAAGSLIYHVTLIGTYS